MPDALVFSVFHVPVDLGKLFESDTSESNGNRSVGVAVKGPDRDVGNRLDFIPRAEAARRGNGSGEAIAVQEPKPPIEWPRT